MEKKDRIIGFTFYAAAIFFIAVIVYYNYLVLKHSFDLAGNSFLPYFINLISAFICALLLQGEEIYILINFAGRANSIYNSQQKSNFCSLGIDYTWFYCYDFCCDKELATADIQSI